ncbi:DUF6597 domain-containing transcriptional factor [Chitinophaga sp. 30R24]|uniref:DUF6597 domain-containing transcriptional factor n=1 Tax=Chitinophaga sp. 30R24 TaxID=3248838 RepID=UPI003B8F7DC0
MRYQEIPPPAYLQHHVRYFWTLESDGPNPLPQVFGPVADGCPGLIFQQSDKGTFYQEDKQLPDLLLYGQTTRYTELQLIGTICTIGVCCYPHALKTVFGLPADELTDACMDLDTLPYSKTFQLSVQLAHATSLTAKIGVIATFLGRQLQKNCHTADPLTQLALSEIMASKGSIALKTLQQQLQVTERSFERRFKQGVGISPKLFSRICRFQHSLTQLRNSHYNKLSDIAFENDYADQSHYIRVFKEFAGFSPNQYQKKSNEVVANFPLITK